MSKIPHDELISAYLDGEVTADERAKVERLLAADPRSRQLLEELRALRGSLASLPRHALEADFSDRVMEAAERRMLLEPRPASESSPSADLDRAARRQRLLRPLAYACATIAAALLVMALTPFFDTRDGRELARAPEGDPLAAQPQRRSGELRAVDEAEHFAKSGEPAAAAGGRHGAIPSAATGLSAMPMRVVGNGAADDLLIVRCQVNRANWRESDFTALLHDQGIVWETVAINGAAAPADDAPEPQADVARATTDEKGILSRGERAADEEVAADAVEFVVIDASVDQLDATLAAMKQRPEAFEEFFVCAAPHDASQVMLAEQHNRLPIEATRQQIAPQTPAAPATETATARDEAAHEQAAAEVAEPPLRQMARQVIEQLPREMPQAVESDGKPQHDADAFAARARKLNVRAPRDYHHLQDAQFNFESQRGDEAYSTIVNELAGTTLRERIAKDGRALVKDEGRTAVPADDVAQKDALPFADRKASQSKLRALFVLEFTQPAQPAESTPAAAVDD